MCKHGVKHINLVTLFKMNLLYVLLSLNLVPLSYAYYGPQGTVSNLKSGLYSTLFSIGRDIYSYGSYDSLVSKFRIEEDKTFYADSYYVEALNFTCRFCFSFAMSADSVLTLTGYDNSAVVSDSLKNNMGVYYFNPLTNTVSKSNRYKMLQGNPVQRTYHQAVITPDKKLVYIFGGIEYNLNMNVNLSIVQFDVSTSTFTSRENFAFVGGTATMLPSGIVVLAFGASGMNQEVENVLYDTSYVYLYDTNKNELYKQNISGTPPIPRASASGTLGMVIGAIILVSLIFYFIWKRFGSFKKIIQRKSILSSKLNPFCSFRLGEPAWAEILRIITRSILLGILLVYIMYSIIRAIDSPNLSQEQIVGKSRMPIPDIRVCSQPHNEFTISCVFTNDRDCSRYFYPIKNDSIIPSGDFSSNKPYCQIFIPPVDFYFRRNEVAYIRDLNNDLKIDIYGKDKSKRTTFYFNYYTTQRSPYRTLFGMNSDDSKMTLDDANNWLQAETRLLNQKIKFDTAEGNWATSTYLLTETRKLTNSSWNYIGFANDYSTTLTLDEKFSPVSLIDYPSLISFPTFMFRVKPDEYFIHMINEQRVSTILGGLASAGGVFSAFMALQTLLFGFRPNSPWGVVHHWSWGRRRITLRDQLRDQFNPGGFPVPMADPVRSDYHSLLELSGSATLDMIPLDDSDDKQSDRLKIRKIEDRIQLMEDIFKAYYIDDEIFQKLNETRKNSEIKMVIEDK
ncbi:hypothetical protein K501DRAFT_272635 [Backusella circina FSU 941]|nr:hypothetical protein K501DRAFT_272635 [Backusella circina FSU 941]